MCSARLNLFSLSQLQKKSFRSDFGNFYQSLVSFSACCHKWWLWWARSTLLQTLRSTFISLVTLKNKLAWLMEFPPSCMQQVVPSCSCSRREWRREESFSLDSYKSHLLCSWSVGLIVSLSSRNNQFSFLLDFALWGYQLEWLLYPCFLKCSRLLKKIQSYRKSMTLNPLRTTHLDFS